MMLGIVTCFSFLFGMFLHGFVKHKDRAEGVLALICLLLTVICMVNQ